MSIQSGFIDLQDLWEDYKRDDLKESVLAGRFKPKKGSNLIRSVETTPVIKTLFDPQKMIAPDKDNYWKRWCNLRELEVRSLYDLTML